MSPVDAAIVRRKLGHIITSLELLRPIAGLAVHDYRGRVWERKGTERVLQEAIEAALDINAHLIAELGTEVPDDYFGGFIKMASSPSSRQTWRGRSPRPPDFATGWSTSTTRSTTRECWQPSAPVSSGTPAASRRSRRTSTGPAFRGDGLPGARGQVVGPGCWVLADEPRI